MKNKLRIVLSAVHKADTRGVEAIPVSKIQTLSGRNKITFEDILEVAYEDWIIEASYIDPKTSKPAKAYKIMPKGIDYLDSYRRNELVIWLTILGLLVFFIPLFYGYLV